MADEVGRALRETRNGFESCISAQGFGLQMPCTNI
jgi:hypothetical protein